MAPRKEMNRTSGVARRKAPNASYNDSPFKGSDPFSQIASFAWRLPGAIASGRTLSGRKVTGEEVSGLAAMAALAGAGIYAGTRGVRGTRPASGTNAGRSGARPMTTAERSASVTRAGRTGVGYIGQGNFRALQGSNYMGKSRYDLVYDEAARISQSRKPVPFSGNVPANLRQSGMSPAAAARARQTMAQIEQDRIERAAIRNKAWAFFQGKGGRPVIKDLDRVYEGSLTNSMSGPRVKRKKNKKK